MFYYFNQNGIVKMKSEAPIYAPSLQCVELPDENLAGKITKVENGRLILEDHPNVVSENLKLDIDARKRALKEKIQNKSIKMDDIADFINDFF